MDLATEATPVARNRDATIRQYAPLVKYVVGRLAVGLPVILDYEDLVSYGTIGLIEAVDRFDESQGVKFQSYAINRIRGAVLDALRALDRFPRSVRHKAKQMDAATLELTAAHRRAPTHVEVAEAMGLQLPQYHQALVDCKRVTVSLDGLMDRNVNKDGGAPTELPADPNEEDFTGRLEKSELLDALIGAVNDLPERELLIVSLYYREEMRMREIAQILDVSESRVCQLHARALSRLRGDLSNERAA